jgi:hypothetical protein
MRNPAAGGGASDKTNCSVTGLHSEPKPSHNQSVSSPLKVRGGRRSRAKDVRP